MTKEELKDKYSAFIAEISEIMGLGKPIDILKLCATTDLFFRPLENRITDLEKENAKLKCECRTCVYTDSPCVRSDYPSKDGVCSHYKNVFDENAELKEELKKWEDRFALKDEEMGCVETDFNTFRSKAKEIIDDLVHLGEFNEHTDEEYVNHQVHEALKNAEQFLNSEVEE